MSRKYLESNSYDMEIHGDVDFDFFDSGGKENDTNVSFPKIEEPYVHREEENEKPSKSGKSIKNVGRELLTVEVHHAPVSNLHDESTTNVEHIQETRNDVILEKVDCVSSETVGKKSKSTVSNGRATLIDVPAKSSKCLHGNVKSSRASLFNSLTDKCTSKQSTKLPKYTDTKKYKELKNCIAFREESVCGKKLSETNHRKLMSVLALNEAGDCGEGSESDSDMTDVTPISSSYESLVFGRNNRDQMFKETKESALQYNSKEKAIVPNGVDEDEKRVTPDDKLPDMKLLIEAINELENGSQYSARQSSVTTKEKRGRKNMALLREEARRIDRENQILLNKIIAQQKSRATPTPAPTRALIASSAINRKQRQRKIERENMILLNKIHSAKSTVGSLPKIEDKFVIHDKKYFQQRAKSRSSSSSSSK